MTEPMYQTTANLLYVIICGLALLLIVTGVVVMIMRRRVQSLEDKMRSYSPGFDTLSSEKPLDTPSPEILDLIRQGRKIDAIKAYIEQTGVGLKEAKEHIEAFEQEFK